MQLLLSASLIFLVIIPALCWPTTENVHNQQAPPKENVHNQQAPPGENVHSQQGPPRVNVHNQQAPPRVNAHNSNQQAQRQNAPMQRGSSAAVTKQFYEYAKAAQNSDEPDESLSKDLIDEISSKLEDNDGRQTAKTEARTSYYYLRQGSTVGLQLAENYLWLDCSGSYCSSDYCPGKSFDADDVNGCTGEVFEMYSLYGGYYILSGDYIGLYYRPESTWFSMWPGYGLKSSCPGTPTYDYGFCSSTQWEYCGGEIFQVFVENGSYGDYIRDEDTIALYYVNGGYFVDFETYWPTISYCMYSCPPSYWEFDWCYHEGVELAVYD